MSLTSASASIHGTKMSWRRDFKLNWVLYLLFLPTLAYYFIFNYIPMAGIAIAFQDYRISKGIWGSEWIAFENFENLFTGETFPLVMRNTCMMALMNITLGFAVPIVFAILLSQLRSKRFKRGVQIMSYMPHFVAAVVVAQLAREFLATNGALTQFLSLFGLAKQNWLANPDVPVFWLINTLTGIWQEIGFSSIIFVAAIANVSAELHEAAATDGANRWQEIWKITLPSIKPMIIMMFIINCGMFFTTGFDKVLLLYMPSTYDTSDVLSTYTYRMAFGSGNDYGLSSASGLFQSVLSLVLLVVSNNISKKVSDTSLF